MENQFCRWRQNVAVVPVRVEPRGSSKGTDVVVVIVGRRFSDSPRF